MTEEELRAGLDEIKAAIFVLTDRLSQSMHDLDAASAGLQAVAQELRQSLARGAAAGRGEIPDALLAIPIKLEALLVSQARMNSQMELLARACQQLPMAVEASALPTPAHFEGMKSVVSSALEGQLEGHVGRLDKLESELAEDSRKTKDALLAVASSLSVLGDSLHGKRELEDSGDLRQSLDNLVADGRKREEVLAETLGALLDAVADMKSKFEAGRDSADINTTMQSAVEKIVSSLEKIAEGQNKQAELLSDLVGDLSQEVDELNQKLSASLSQQPQAMEQALDAKLSRLAQLEAQLLEEQRANSTRLDEIYAATAGAAAPREESTSDEKIILLLQRIADSQNRQNEVIADALSTVLEEITQLKAGLQQKQGV